MSRTIDSGSNRKCTKQCGARFNDSLPIVSGDDAGDVTVDLASHLPLVAARTLAHRVVDFHAVLGGINALVPFEKEESACGSCGKARSVRFSKDLWTRSVRP